MDTMSDGAGINAVNCPDGYLTGYALPEREKYVLAKTWYADDKERSGCVWTHSLIFDIADISYMRFTKEIFDSMFSEHFIELINIAEKNNKK